jgi:hypothetical protein
MSKGNRPNHKVYDNSKSERPNAVVFMNKAYAAPEGSALAVANSKVSVTQENLTDEFVTVKALDGSGEGEIWGLEPVREKRPRKSPRTTEPPAAEAEQTEEQTAVAQ